MVWLGSGLGFFLLRSFPVLWLDRDRSVSSLRLCCRFASSASRVAFLSAVFVSAASFSFFRFSFLFGLFFSFSAFSAARFSI